MARNIDAESIMGAAREPPHDDWNTKAETVPSLRAFICSKDQTAGAGDCLSGEDGYHAISESA
jgi:hypothetical protein